MIPTLLKLITTFMWGGFYYYVTEKINNYKDNFNTHSTKVSRNIVSFSHSTICTLLAYLTLQTSLNPIVLYYFSLSYFLWDTCLIVYNQLTDEIPYIYHHAVCLMALYNLNNGVNVNEITTIFYYGEMSNVFNYIVYHLLKQKSTNNSLLLSVKTMQVGWFSYFRVYVFTQLLYAYFSLIESRFLVYNLGCIYIMGLMWGYKQSKKVYIDYKKLIKNK